MAGNVIVEGDAAVFEGGAAGASSRGAVSWSAVFAGAAASVALGVVLTTLAAGFGLETPYPGSASRASLAAFTPEVGAGAVAAQVACGALGGYLAGRLRGAWPGVHSDETHFRDTAHGLVAWAVSTLAGVVLASAVLGPAAAALAGAAAESAATLSASARAAAAERAAHVAAQASFFAGVGMLLSAFTACVAAALGGLQAEGGRAQR